MKQLVERNGSSWLWESEQCGINFILRSIIGELSSREVSGKSTVDDSLSFGAQF